MPEFRLVSLIAVATALIAAPALAQEADAGANDSKGTAITVIGAAQPLVDAGGSIAVLTADDLNAFQDVTVADAVARLPGVAVTRNGGLGGFTGVRIRGADASQTLVVIDGVRVGDPSAPGGGFDFATLLGSGIARIELLRGSNSIVWGSDAIGGVMLIETEQPGVGAPQGELLAEGGSYGTVRASGRYAASAGPLSIGSALSYIDSVGFSSAANGSEADGFRQWAANGRVAVAVTERLRLVSGLVYADSRTELDGYAPPTYSFGDTPDYQTAQELYAHAGVEHEGAALAQRLTLSLADINRDTFEPAAGTTPTFSARGRSERVSWQGDWVLSGDRATARMRLLLGLDHEVTRMVTASAFGGDRQRTHSSGGHLSAVIRPTAALTIGGGVRLEDHRDFGSHAVWAANAVWALAPALNLRAGYAEGYKAPTLFQLSADPFAYGNPALQPERSRSYDVGLHYGGEDDALRFALSLYRRDSRDLIDFVSCGGTGGPAICAGGTRFFGTYDNIGRARAEGIEAEASLALSDAIRIHADYAHTATRDRTPGSFSLGNRLPRRPLDTAGIGLTGAVGAATLGADLRYVGASYDDRGNTVRLDEFVTVNLRARARLGQRIELFGRVENLLDERYQTVAGYGTPGRTAHVGLRLPL